MPATTANVAKSKELARARVDSAVSYGPRETARGFENGPKCSSRFLGAVMGAERDIPLQPKAHSAVVEVLPVKLGLRIQPAVLERELGHGSEGGWISFLAGM